ncbi:MAG: L-aspartate oxidase [Gammaproteobacteria bacterium]|nr:L-aspartate oxidase [Gammaproteobacteria bacterium]
MINQYKYDVLVIGSGAAGLSLALSISSEARIAVFAKSNASEGSTLYAQGGISAVFDPKDSFDSHVADTMDAGAGLCHADSVRQTIEQAPQAIQFLLDHGVRFTPTAGDDSSFHLTKEGGHSHRRILHAADKTGQEMETSLLEQAHNRSNIDIFEDHLVVDLITTQKIGQSGNRCLGAYVFNRKAGQVVEFSARFTALATGGASKVYLYTSNPDVSTGDGIAIAWRAGCRVANMEFIQFHPTCLYHPQAKSFLISEAVRGEGGKLLLPDGTRFMQRFDPRGELAPRDIVARAIDHEMKRLGADYLLLDISYKSADFIKKHFPTIYERCLEFGYDMTKEPLPVVPAAHYTCGGVMTDAHAQTDVENLFAVGEVAFTGLHGANRMASNSLLECIVFAFEAAKQINANLKNVPLPRSLPRWDESRVTDSDEEVVVSHNWNELRHFMWDYVGIVRTTKRLERAKRRIQLLKQEIADYYGNFRVTGDLLELRNLVMVAELIVDSAMARRESRGLHYTLDFPETNNALKQDTVLIPPNYVPLERDEAIA